MLEILFGSENGAKALLFLHARNQGYAREIAGFFNTAHRPIQKQLAKFEAAGILCSRMDGRTRTYTFNPRCPLSDEIRALLEKALSMYPEKEREALMMNRRRPRRPDKPL